MSSLKCATFSYSRMQLSPIAKLLIMNNQTETVTHKIEAELHADNQFALVTKEFGKICQHLGKVTKNGRQLNAEEILYLLEMGKLTLTQNNEILTIETIYGHFLNTTLYTSGSNFKIYKELLNFGYRVKRSENCAKTNDNYNLIALPENNSGNIWRELSNMGPRKFSITASTTRNFRVIFDIYKPTVKSLSQNTPNFQLITLNNENEMKFALVNVNDEPVKLTVVGDSLSPAIYQSGTVVLPNLA